MSSHRRRDATAASKSAAWYWTKGVLPAVDKVVEIGIADPERIGVMGNSYGGYSALGLGTQTSRFKAAVVAAGITDLVSVYGAFDPETRYADTYIPSSQRFLAEKGQFRMGGPVWQDSQYTFVWQPGRPVMEYFAEDGSFPGDGSQDARPKTGAGASHHRQCQGLLKRGWKDNI